MARLNVPNRTLFIADNLPILRGIDSESVDLIATDPPFNKGVKAFEGIVTAGVDAQGKKVSYKDVWTWGDVQEEWTEQIRIDHPKLHAVIQAANTAAGEDMGAFLCWLGVRVLEMHRILKPTGSLYLQCDHTAGAWIKAMLDAIFGRMNLRNEIVWKYKYGGRSQTAFGRKHDVLLYYSKTKNFTFNSSEVRVDHEPDSLEMNFTKTDEHGRRYREGTWKSGKKYRYYADEGRTPDDVWTDINSIHAASSERTGYPTQKPLALLERIIKASSNEGDMVLDPFAGCATTCVAAEQLGRQWVGIDINTEAGDVILERLRREVQEGMVWDKRVRIATEPPTRTDNGEHAAPELVLVGRTTRGSRLSVRELRDQLTSLDDVKCQGCGYRPPNGLAEYLEVDHKQPKSRGGSDDLRNRVLLCAPCNSVKGNKLTLAELRLKRITDGRNLDPSWTPEWYERIGRFGESIPR